jgi:hypothetical protein
VVQALLSLQVIVTWVHALFEHPSVVQASLSLHDAGTVAACTHPVAELHESVVQMLLSLQLLGVKTQPVAGLQVSVVQALLSLQTIGVWTQLLATHASVVQTLLSLHCASVVHDLQAPSSGSQL